MYKRKINVCVSNVKILEEEKAEIKRKAFLKLKNNYLNYLVQNKRTEELEHNLNLSKSAKLSRGYKYAISNDLNDRYEKNYKGFDDINELLKYIKETEHCYEQLNSEICKMYVDIDFDNEQENKLDYMKVPKFQSFVNSFIKKLNNLLEEELTEDDIIILVKEKVIDDIKYINSCHLIVKNYCMSRKEQKELFNELNYHCDLKVYGNYGQLSLKGHCKYGKSSKFYCLNGDYSDLDCLVSYTENCKELKKGYKIVECKIEDNQEEDESNLLDKEVINISNLDDIFLSHVDKLSDKLFNNSYDWKYVTRLMVKLQVGDIDDWLRYSSKKSKNKSWSYESNKKFLLSIDISKLKGGKPILLEKLNKYSDLYKFEYSVNLEKLCKYILLKKGYKTDRQWNGDIVTSTKYWKKVNENELINGNYKLYITTGYLYENALKKSVAKTPFGGRVGGNPPSSKTFCNAKLLGNFYLEYELKLIYEKTKDKNELNYDIVVDKIDDSKIYSLLDDFIAKEFNLLVVKSFMGTGKSYYIVRNLIKKLYKSEDYFDKVSDFLTPNNALNVELTNKLNSYKYLKFYSHLDKIPEGLDSDKYSLVCSLESLKKVDISHTNINILVLDEIETILKHIESSTVKDKYTSYKLLKRVIQKSELVICLDANISKSRINWIESVIEEKRKCIMKSLYVKQNNYLDYTHNFYVDKCHFDNNLLEDLKEGKRVGFCSNRKDKTEILLRKVRELDENIPILLINGSHIKIMKGDYVRECKSEKDKKKFIMDLEDNILGKDPYTNIDNWINQTKVKFSIQLFIYSPTVTTGTSINAEHFDKLYCYFDNCSLPVRELIQQMYRIRKLKEKEINIYFSTKPNFLEKSLSKKNSGMATKPFEIESPKTLEHYKLCMLLPFNVLTSSLKDGETHNIIGYDDNRYLNLRSYNLQEEHISQNYTIQEFYKQLVYSQGINLNFVDKEENKELIKEKDILQEMRLEKYEDYATTSIITMERYLKLYEKNELDLSSKEFSEMLKLKWLCKFKLINYNDKNIEITNYYGYYPYQFVRSNQEYLNSREFYDIYIKHKHIYNNVLSYMNFDRKKYEKQLKNPHIQIGIEVLDSSLKKNLILYKCIDKIREIFGINFKKDIIITNTELKELLNDNLEFIQTDLYHYEVSYNVSTSKLNTLDLSKKESIKKMYTIINQILSHINYGLKYVDKNTTRETDKIRISQNNIIHLNYVEELRNNNHYKFEIEKTKEGKLFKCVETIKKRTSSKEQKIVHKKYKYISNEYTHLCKNGLPYLNKEDKNYPVKELKLKNRLITEDINHLYKLVLTELIEKTNMEILTPLKKLLFTGKNIKVPYVYNCDEEMNTIIFNCDIVFRQLQRIYIKSLEIQIKPE